MTCGSLTVTILGLSSAVLNERKERKENVKPQSSLGAVTVNVAILSVYPLC